MEQNIVNKRAHRVPVRGKKQQTTKEDLHCGVLMQTPDSMAKGEPEAKAIRRTGSRIFNFPLIKLSGHKQKADDNTARARASFRPLALSLTPVGRTATDLSAGSALYPYFVSSHLRFRVSPPEVVQRKLGRSRRLHFQLITFRGSA